MSYNNLTMKIGLFLFVTLLSSVLGAPAVVWKNKAPSNEQRFLHSSEELTASELLINVLPPESEAPEASSLSSVIFLVGKGEDGSEQLTVLASSGKLPETSQKYEDASNIYHHVSGIESTTTIVRDAVRATNQGNHHRVLEVTLDELNSKLSGLGTPMEMEIDNQGIVKTSTKSSSKRAKDLARADVYIVTINATRDADEIDAAISSAIENKYVDSVILAGIRSIHEVKHERYLASKRRTMIMEQEGNKVLDSRRRRLEEQQQQQQGDDDAAQAQDNGNDDLSGVYYVSMTPNILSGLLFTFLFAVVTYIGVSCMGDIQGQDVFTDKMPSIGREA